MAGLTGVANAASARNAMSGENLKEVFLTDGLTVGFSVMSNGEDDNIDHISRHYVSDVSGHGGSSGRYVYCRAALADLPCWVCDNGGGKPQMLFSFWSYVHTLRSENKPKNVEGWETKSQRGRTYYERVVNEPRIISVPVGRKDIYLNAFIDIYQMGSGGEGGFDKVINITRKGSGRDDTTYTILPTNVDVKSDEIPVFDSVGGIRDYFLSKQDSEDAFFGVSGGSNNNTTSVDDDEDDGLPF